MGTFTYVFCPSISLSASLTRATAAAIPRPPDAVGYYVTRHCHVPTVWGPPVQCDFSPARRGSSPVSHLAALMLEPWSRVSIYLKAFSYSGPHSKGSLPDPVVVLNSGLAISEKPTIQIWQIPAALRNSQTSFLVFDGGTEEMVCFLSCPNTQSRFERTNPRYLTSCLEIWAFFHDTLYPVVERRANNTLVPFQQLLGWDWLATGHLHPGIRCQFKVSLGEAARSAARA